MFYYLRLPSQQYYIGYQTLHRVLVLLCLRISLGKNTIIIYCEGHKILGLLRRRFCNANCVRAKKLRYLSLVRSQLPYCSPVWCPNLIKDILSVQHRATKYILNDFSSDYKSHLTKLNLLPLMMQLEINDIIFFIKNLKEPSSSFDITSFVHFCSNTTRSST